MDRESMMAKSRSLEGQGAAITRDAYLSLSSEDRLHLRHGIMHRCGQSLDDYNKLIYLLAAYAVTKIEADEPAP